MTRSTLCRAVLLPLCLLGLIAFPADGQYFGRNKVQYETFHWRIVRGDHFDNFFYPPESAFVWSASRQAERWYTRLSDTFRHAFDRKSLIFYADHPDFQQTNVISEQLQEGTGGVTEGLRTRVIMPFTGINADDDHVLGHELVHVFQYNIAEAAPGGGLARLGALPGWVVEGMAEYLSLGRENELTAMWMRDAVLRNRFPTIKQLTNDPRFFPYRYGQALWAYVGGRWGDRAVIDVYRASLRLGWDQALVRVLGINQDSLSKDWAAANRALYEPQLANRTKPDSLGHQIVGLQHRAGDQNVSPSLSPDGRMLAFVSSRALFSTDIYIANAETGEIIRKLGGPSSDPHIDNISWINSAGDWSPDASQFAFIAYANGDNQIGILNTGNGDITRRISLGEIGAVTHIAWSPDGRTLAFSGMKGGQSDIYLFDLTSGAVTQLTNDRYSDIQPAWSPDGRSIAFSSDRGQGTSFNTLTYGSLQLAVLDVGTRQVTVVPGFARGKHINPQFSPDGRDLFFVSDNDGISNLYRVSLSSGQMFRVTNVQTGISGITSVSPAITVARNTGRVAFDIFQEQGFRIHSLEASQAAGQPVETGATTASLAVLPPGDAAGRTLITAYLHDPSNLPSGDEFRVMPYRASFSLDALGQPSVGVTAGGPFGSGFVGGVSAFFGDQLSDQQIITALQANGTVKDIGGAAYYINYKQRWNYGLGVEHIPYLTGGVFLADSISDDTASPCSTPGRCYTINQILQRVYVSQLSLMTQYPFSMTRRFELNLSATRLGYNFENQQFLVVDNQIAGQRKEDLTDDSFKPMYYTQPSIALVGDNSFAAFTSPVAGSRWRLEYSPTIGNISFQTALADYRRYIHMRPVTFAFRGMHYGRYGKDSEDNRRLSPLYLGEETLIRGYGYGSFKEEECIRSGSRNTCPVFDRMFGSRLMVANAEMRIPLIGTSEFGLLNFPFLPTEVSPFFDAGLAYTSNQQPQFRVTSEANGTPANCAGDVQTDPNNPRFPCTERIPVFSAGLSFRVNFLGYMIFEAYFAHPFQRPDRNWLWGFQLAPGW
jgi:Tol biopolymer transport system component